MMATGKRTGGLFYVVQWGEGDYLNHMAVIATCRSKTQAMERREEVIQRRQGAPWPQSRERLEACIGILQEVR